MAQTTPPPVDDLPPAPNTNQPQNFSAMMDTFLAALIVFKGQLVALALNVYNNAVDAWNSANSAFTQAQIATSAASIATTASGALPFNPLTTYAALTQPAISNVNGQSYRRKTAGASPTDPALDTINWRPSIFLPGYDGASSAGAVTLTVNSGGAQSITTTAPGQAVILPDASTCGKAAILFNIYNSGEFDLALKNNGGQIKGFVRPFTNVAVGLADNTTANGAWLITGAEILGVVAQRELSSTPSGSADSIIAIPLDAVRTLLLYGSTIVYAQVFDKSSQTWGTAVVVATTAVSGKNYRGLLAAANLVLIAYSASGSTLRSLTLSVSGTSVVVNAEVSVSAVGGGNLSALDLIAVGGAYVFAAGSASTNLIGITLSGTVPTLSATPATTSTTHSAGGYLFAVSSSVVVITGGAGSTNIMAQAFSLTGATLTPGTENKLTDSATTWLRAIMLGSGRLMILYSKSGVSAQARLYTFSGTNISAAEVVASNTGNVLDWCVVGSNKILMAQINTSAIRYNHLIDTAGTPSIGTPADVPMSGTPSLGVMLQVTGSLVKAHASSATSFALCSVDTSGVSPAVTVRHRVRTQLSGSAITIAEPGPSDPKGNRDPSLLYNGSLATVVPTGINSPHAQMIMGDRYNYVQHSPLTIQPATSAMALGQNGRETWQISGSGITIGLLEMAA